MNSFTETIKQVFQIGEPAPPTDNVIDLLKADHKKVEDLFKDFEDAESKDEKLSIIKTIIEELTVHTVAEEKLVYSHLIQGEDEEEKTREAFEEHHLVQGLISDLSDFNGNEANFDAKVKVLSELIKHHVKEEELDLLPKLNDKDLDLDELGRQFNSDKEKLKKNPPEFESVSKIAVERPRAMKPIKRAAAKKASDASVKRAAAKRKATAKKSAAKTAAKSKVTKPAAKKVAAKKPAVKKATAKKTAAKKPAAKKPVAKKAAKPAAKKTVAKKSAPKTTKKAATKKPATKKAAAKKTAAKKPAAKKPAAATRRR